MLASCDCVISKVCNVKERESENEKCFEMKIHIKEQDLVLKFFMASSPSLLPARVAAHEKNILLIKHHSGQRQANKYQEVYLLVSRIIPKKVYR